MVTKWGKMWTLIHFKHFWLKIIHVNKGHRTSFQYHNYRKELHIGRRIKYIGIQVAHRMTEGWYIEIAWGPDVRESDITRLEDDYGRCG